MFNKSKITAVVATSLLIGTMIFSCTKENKTLLEETGKPTQKSLSALNIYVEPGIPSGIYVGHLRDNDGNIILTYRDVVDNGELVASFIDDYELYPNRDTTVYKQMGGKHFYRDENAALGDYFYLVEHYPCVQFVRQETPSLNGTGTWVSYTIWYGELDNDNKCWYEQL